MKYFFATVALLLGLCASAGAFDAAQLRGLTDDDLFKQVRIYRCSPTEMDALLGDLHRRFPAFDDRVQALARLYLGAAYVTDPLTQEVVDWLPYTAVNCTMLVLYIEAFANSHTMSQAREHMRHLHYRGGAVGFVTRYHFTEDRITDPANAYFREATRTYVRDAGRLASISLELNRKKDGSLLFGDRLGGWTKKVTLAYVPRRGFTAQMLKRLPRVMGIAFVKKENWAQGLIVGHEGLLIDGDLYHASQKHGVTIEKKYLADGFPKSGWEGMILFELRDRDEAQR